ncbi:DUF1989 domain-containing protein [Sneathiella marina]|uniref:DUF1989 domain-containing protein n=1 Tax=Sneathiella marina TaxID=2950108 RepID=A0ABY4WB87_9PROT|nr:DUF1989 domain-containing protein [Sneathiella marina]USG61931.1 DUF1989 domain-containing protein [Sneathiella marina]
MKNHPQNPAPEDAGSRRACPAVICYPIDDLPTLNPSCFSTTRETMTLVDEVIIPPRDAKTFMVPAGYYFRIVSFEGPQVGDLNLWNAQDLDEKFFSGKTRALHGTHVSVGDRLWSNLPNMRSMATITYDTLDWYGWDEDGGSVHDVIGTRCDPYTNILLTGNEYHHCCHSNLIRAIASEKGMSTDSAEGLVHDVLNVFMCTGFTQDTHQYFMKASPVRPGDYLEFFAEIDLLGALSTCPGGDCSSGHSSEEAQCYPLKVEIYKPAEEMIANWIKPTRSPYSRSHGQ